MRTRLLVFDGTWLLHRAVYATMRNSSEPVLATYSMIIGWVCSYAIKHAATHAVVCFDGRSCFRYDIFPDYKKARRSDPDAELEEVETAGGKKVVAPRSPISALIPELESILHELNIGFHTHPRYEADDLLASYSVQTDYDSIILVCRDKDMMALVNDSRKVRIYQPEVGKNAPEQILDEKAVFDKFGHPPSRRVAYQILVGDSGDSVPSVYKKKKAMEIIKSYPTLADYFRNNNEEWLEHRQALSLNHKLVRLRTDVRVLEKDDLAVSSIREASIRVEGKTLRLPKSLSELQSVASRKQSRGLFN